MAFFFYAEMARLYWADAWKPTPGQHQYTPHYRMEVPPNSSYTEQCRHMVELGLLAGPVKIRFLHAWTPGPDGKNGILIGKQLGAFAWYDVSDRWLGNTVCFAHKAVS